MESGAWAGGDNGGFGKRQGGICAGESSNPWPYSTSSLKYYTSYKDATYFVYEDRNFDLALDFAGQAVDERSKTTGPYKTSDGIGTGTDRIGGLWIGKFKVGNFGPLGLGLNTFGTRSDDGSAFWIDLDQDGDFSSAGKLANELVVLNKRENGTDRKVGTRFMGRKTPLLLRPGLISDKGIALGADGHSVSWHGTFDQQHKILSNVAMGVNEWYHLVSVVDRENGRMKQYLNGKLVAEKMFNSGREGENSKGDWYIGGMPELNDRFSGLIDDVRIYSAALSDDDIARLYNNQGGDMGLIAEFVAPSITDDSNISVNLRFLKFDQPVLVTGIIENDLNVTGATIADFNSLDGNFSFNLIPKTGATEIKISLAEGAGQLISEPTLSSNLFIPVSYTHLTLPTICSV